MGCGRMFEGNAQQMWTSLSKMKPLPPSTKVFCAHEYTQSNAKFALSVDPDNQALQKRAALVNDLRKQVGAKAVAAQVTASTTCALSTWYDMCTQRSPMLLLHLQGILQALVPG